MGPSPAQLYLDLMKKALLFTLWPDPPLPIHHHERSRIKRCLFSLITRFLNKRNWQIVQNRKAPLTNRLEGRGYPGNAHTLIGQKRLDNLQECVETILCEEIAGDLIETGVWRGGACIFMRAVLAAYGEQTRRVFVADSFEGLPPINPAKYPAETQDFSQFNWLLAVSQAEVEANFRNYGLLDEQVVFLKGWFKDTLPAAPIERLALLRLDGDIYESTMDALVHLYPKLSRGGFCIIDDYALAPCRAAVDDYRAQQGIQDKMQAIDWAGVYWQKSQEHRTLHKDGATAVPHAHG